MTPPDYDKYRAQFAWHVVETEHCVFHVDASLAEDVDIAEIINDAPARHAKIAALLKFDLNGIYGEKIHYWFFSRKILSLLGIDPGKKPFSTGQLTNAGIDYVVANDRWNNHVQHVFHEEVHQLVMRETGEAPALLNEGIAVYVESMVFHGKDEFRHLCAKTWKKHMKKDRLSQLIANEFFWSKYGKWPVYTLGAAVVHYLIETHGIDTLKDVCKATDYDDTQFCRLMEAKLGTTVDDLQRKITGFYR